MNTLRPFQIILLAFFGLLAIVALIFLSLYQASKQNEELAYGERVVVWGTLPQDTFKQLFQEITKTDKPFNAVEYRQIDERTFDEELVNAIAEQQSPDLIILSSDALVTHRSKLLPIPYESFPVRDFKDTFADGAEFFALAEGIYGIPFAVDPLVMYWNRDLFATNAIANPPKTWEEVVGVIVPKISQRTDTREILQSGIAFGEYRNIENAKDILMMLALQTGSKMTVAEEDRYVVALNEAQTDSVGRPFESVLQFYTDFSNVNSPLYSWNRAVSSAKATFLGGDLALYFGRGSEWKDIAEKNPNLNFDMAQVPQGANATVFRTYGSMYSFAIPKGAGNPQGAYAVARVLSGKEPARALTEALNMAPVRRDLLGEGSENAFRRVMLEGALIARAWLDPERTRSGDILKQMVEDVVSNRSRVGDAVSDAIDRLELTY
jgi:ABC-type glycerol-3-phosphate transport system substrate-binding protein